MTTPHSVGDRRINGSTPHSLSSSGTGSSTTPGSTSSLNVAVGSSLRILVMKMIMKVTKLQV